MRKIKMKEVFELYPVYPVGSSEFMKNATDKWGFEQGLSIKYQYFIINYIYHYWNISQLAKKEKDTLTIAINWAYKKDNAYHIVLSTSWVENLTNILVLQPQISTTTNGNRAPNVDIKPYISKTEAWLDSDGDKGTEAIIPIEKINENFFLDLMPYDIAKTILHLVVSQTAISYNKHNKLKTLVEELQRAI